METTNIRALNLGDLGLLYYCIVASIAVIDAEDDGGGNHRDLIKLLKEEQTIVKGAILEMEKR